MKRLYSAAHPGVYAESQGERTGNNDLKVFDGKALILVDAPSETMMRRRKKKNHHASAQSGTKGRDDRTPVELQPLPASEQMHTAVSSSCTETSSAITHDEK